MTYGTVTRLGFAAVRAGLSVPGSSRASRFGEQTRLRDLLRRLDVDTILDVGANEGWWSKHARMLGFGGPILSFEPLPENVAKIRQKAGDDRDWFIKPVALGAEAGRQSFHVIRTEGGQTTLSSFLEPLNGGTEAVAEVEVERLDSYGDLIGERAFLKIDTQGYDVEVLRGAAGILDRVVALQSEISVTPLYDGAPHYTEALAYYESLGFALLDLTLVNRTPEGIVMEYDCLMVRKAIAAA